MALWLIAALLLALKLAYAVTVPPNIDEAYYFVWGLVPQASYLDHAPMVGWSSGLARLLAGLSPFTVHLPALLSFGVIAFALYRWNRATGGGRFAAMLAVLLASPLLSILTTLNYPDHALICFGLLATLSLTRFLDAFGAGSSRWRDLYFGALWLGLAGLSKYSAVALGLALVLTILSVKRFRPLFRAPQLYLAGLLTLMLVSPVIWWNIEHRFASVALHTGERYRAETGFGVTDTFRLLWQSVLFFSPALAVALWRFLRGVRGTETTALTHLGRWTLLLISLVMFGLSTWSGAEGQVKPHWLAIGFVPFLPVMADLIGRGWLRRLHLGFGLVVMTALTLYYVAAPLSYSWAVAKDGEAAVTFGLEQVVAAAEAQATSTGATAFVFKNYWSAAKFSAARGSIDGVVTISPIPDQFQLWTPSASLAGRDAIIVLAPGEKPDLFAPHFDSLTELPAVTTTRFGQPLATWRLVLGKGWKG